MPADNDIMQRLQTIHTLSFAKVLDCDWCCEKRVIDYMSCTQSCCAYCQHAQCKNDMNCVMSSKLKVKRVVYKIKHATLCSLHQN